ncbi:MAG: type II toxin-antitoxin system PemK/MazF family toxin [Conexibacteraceae bacterium]|nr:type II toxin-antitoxin system PemK/MazF family toxin [Conexibacteraceae bacterium]
MRRGDVYLVDFEPSQGAEVNKRRPAVIVSNEGANRSVRQRRWGVIDVVPLTSRVSEVQPYQVLIPAEECGLRRDSRAQAEQVRAVSFGRLLEYLGHVPTPLMRQIDDALRIQLAL